MYIHVSGFENKNFGSSMLDNILEGKINSKHCSIIAPLHGVCYEHSSHMQKCSKNSQVEMHSVEKSACPDNLTSHGQQKA